MNLHSFSISHPVTPEALDQLPCCTLSRDWFGEPLHTTRKLWFGRAADTLIFAASFASDTSGNRERTGFFEGLFHSDCSELFLLDPESGRYQEFNLAFGSAWWSAEFSGYRKRSDAQPSTDGVTAISLDRGEERLVLLHYPLTRLAVSWEKPLRAHLSSIVDVHPEQQFASSAPLSSIEPDFHNVSCFQDVTAA